MLSLRTYGTFQQDIYVIANKLSTEARNTKLLVWLDTIPGSSQQKKRSNNANIWRATLWFRRVNISCPINCTPRDVFISKASYGII